MVELDGFGANWRPRVRIGVGGVFGGVPEPTYQGDPLAQSTDVIFGGSIPGIIERVSELSGADFSIFRARIAIFGGFGPFFANFQLGVKNRDFLIELEQFSTGLHQFGAIFRQFGDIFRQF